MANFNFPVRKSSYKKLNQLELADFAANVATRMSSNAAYQGAADEVSLLSERSGLYKQAIENAKDRSIHQVNTKRVLQAKVLESLDRIVTWMSLNYTGDEEWILNTGIPIVRKVESRSGKFEAPYRLKTTNENPGELILSFKSPHSKRVRTNDVQYSENGGQTWVNGIFGNSSGTVLRGLPLEKVLLIRVRSVGSDARISAWSEPLKTIVF